MYLAGGGVIDMSHTAFYSGGWSLAMVPLSRLFAGHPGRFYSSVIVLESLLAAGSVVMMAQLCRWLFATRWSVAILAAATAGLYPAFVVNTGLAWSESMLAFALLVVLTASAWLIRVAGTVTPVRRTLIVRVLVAGTACAYLVTVHRRTLFAALGTLVVVCGYLLRKRSPAAAAAMFTSFAVLGYGGERLNRYLDNAIWGGKGGVDTSGKLSSLLTAHGMKEVVITGAGQSWYQLVGTGGLVAIGLLALVFVCLDQKSRSTERRVVAALVVVVFGLLLAVSVAFLANGRRADQVVYGRYVDIATPLLVAVAITWIATRPPKRLLVVVAAGLAVSLLSSWIVLDRWGGDRLAEPFNRVTTIAIVGWIHGGSPQLLRATSWAALIGLGAIAIALVVRTSSRGVGLECRDGCTRRVPVRVVARLRSAEDLVRTRPRFAPYPSRGERGEGDRTFGGGARAVDDRGRPARARVLVAGCRVRGRDAGRRIVFPGCVDQPSESVHDLGSTLRDGRRR